MSSRPATNSNQDTRSSSHVGFGRSFILKFQTDSHSSACISTESDSEVNMFFGCCRSEVPVGGKNVMEHLNSHIKQAYLSHSDDASLPLARSAWSECAKTTLDVILRVFGPDRWGKLNTPWCKQLMFQQEVFSNHWKGNIKRWVFCYLQRSQDLLRIRLTIYY